MNGIEQLPSVGIKMQLRIYMKLLFILLNSSTFTIHKVQLISVNDVERSRQVAALEPVHKLIIMFFEKFNSDDSATYNTSLRKTLNNN